MHDMSFYQQLFEASPHPYMILGVDDRFTIMAVNERYLQVTNRERAAMVGRGLFEVFPNDPNDPQSTSVSDLRASLHRVINSKQADVMSVQQYDITATDGSAEFVRKYWSPVNTPVLDVQGNIFCSAPGGVYVISPTAKLLGKIEGPERPANMAWGGNDGKTLYLTAHTGLYKIETLTGGKISKPNKN